ncbi:hypothetical protein HYX14_06295 [Candidatus Woesearchaeota archaeon]|nr:hypothetical protein [Candidatus Woesearchaeota archaeon]
MAVTINTLDAFVNYLEDEKFNVPDKKAAEEVGKKILTAYHGDARILDYVADSLKWVKGEVPADSEIAEAYLTKTVANVFDVLYAITEGDDHKADYVHRWVATGLLPWNQFQAALRANSITPAKKDAKEKEALERTADYFSGGKESTEELASLRRKQKNSLGYHLNQSKQNLNQSEQNLAAAQKSAFRRGWAAVVAGVAAIAAGGVIAYNAVPQKYTDMVGLPPSSMAQLEGTVESIAQMSQVLRSREDASQRMAAGYEADLQKTKSDLYAAENKLKDLSDAEAAKARADENPVDWDNDGKTDGTVKDLIRKYNDKVKWIADSWQDKVDVDDPKEVKKVVNEFLASVGGSLIVPAENCEQAVRRLYGALNGGLDTTDSEWAVKFADKTKNLCAPEDATSGYVMFKAEGK